MYLALAGVAQLGKLLANLVNPLLLLAASGHPSRPGVGPDNAGGGGRMQPLAPPPLALAFQVRTPSLERLSLYNCPFHRRIQTQIVL